MRYSCNKHETSVLNYVQGGIRGFVYRGKTAGQGLYKPSVTRLMLPRFSTEPGDDDYYTGSLNITIDQRSFRISFIFFW
jgi:hypothetical protein